MTEYNTLRSEGYGEFTEKKSNFICHGSPVNSQDQAEQYIESIKCAYRDARHNVYAYRIKNGGIKKSSDDGEPQGTGGIPILKVLEGLLIEDAVIVVTRYFGGILLGTGGLLRAYCRGARVVIEACGTAKKRLYISAIIETEYNLLGKVSSIIHDLGIKMSLCVYEEKVRVSVLADKEAFSILNERLRIISGGKIRIFKEGEGYYASHPNEG